MFFQILAKIEMMRDKNRLFSSHFETVQNLILSICFRIIIFHSAYMYGANFIIKFLWESVSWGGPRNPPWAPTGVKVPKSLKPLLFNVLQTWNVGAARNIDPLLAVVMPVWVLAISQPLFRARASHIVTRIFVGWVVIYRCNESQLTTYDRGFCKSPFWVAHLYPFLVMPYVNDTPCLTHGIVVCCSQANIAINNLRKVEAIICKNYDSDRNLFTFGKENAKRSMSFCSLHVMILNTGLQLQTWLSYKCA